MYSNEDLERFYFKYQTEALPLGISTQKFCSQHNVPHNLFCKWYRDTRSKIVEVQVEGAPSATPPELTPLASTASAVESRNPSSPIRILVEIRVSNGLYISQKNLDYHGLRHLIEKLEVLC